MYGFEYVFIAVSFGLATAIIARGKGSSFWIWLIVGTVLPILGLLAVILYRSEKVEPERQCPTCNKVVKLYVQVCPRCGTDLYLPDPARAPAAPVSLRRRGATAPARPGACRDHAAAGSGGARAGLPDHELRTRESGRLEGAQAFLLPSCA